MASKQVKLTLASFWLEDQGLSFFLASLVIMIIFVPMVGLSRPERIAVDFTFAVMLVSGTIATIRHWALICLIIALTIMGFTADLIVEFNQALRHWEWDTALKVSGIAILVVMTLKQTFRPGPVSVHRIMGGVAGYLLIGMAWAFGYKLLMEEVPGAIHFQAPFLGNATGEPSRLIYFSFATLTSVSYGDAYPAHRVARSLTMAEALIGQLYPAILIATLVGMALQTPSRAGTTETRVDRENGSESQGSDASDERSSTTHLSPG